MANTSQTVKARFEIGTAKTFASTDVDITADSVYILNHGYKTGDAVGMSTTGAIPTGLTITTAYYIIQVDSSNIAFASSRANAFAGTKVNLTAVGSGTTSVRKNALGTSLSGVIIPANYFVLNAYYQVITAGTATATTGTLACQVVAANDVVSPCTLR